jgi:hypothetical protein
VQQQRKLHRWGIGMIYSEAGGCQTDINTAIGNKAAHTQQMQQCNINIGTAAAAGQAGQAMSKRRSWGEILLCRLQRLGPRSTAAVK